MECTAPREEGTPKGPFQDRVEKVSPMIRCGCVACSRLLVVISDGLIEGESLGLTPSRSPEIGECRLQPTSIVVFFRTAARKIVLVVYAPRPYSAIGP